MPVVLAGVSYAPQTCVQMYTMHVEACQNSIMLFVVALVMPYLNLSRYGQEQRARSRNRERTIENMFELALSCPPVS